MLSLQWTRKKNQGECITVSWTLTYHSRLFHNLSRKPNPVGGHLIRRRTILFFFFFFLIQLTVIFQETRLISLANQNENISTLKTENIKCVSLLINNNTHEVKDRITLIKLNDVGTYSIDRQCATTCLYNIAHKSVSSIKSRSSYLTQTQQTISD